MSRGLHAGLNAQSGIDDVNEQEQQQGDDAVGKDLEALAGHLSVLMHVGMHAVVVVGHRAQLVLNAGAGLADWGLLGGLRPRGLGFGRLLSLDYGLGDGLGLWLRFNNRLGGRLVEWSAQVGTAIGAETDAFGQFLAAAVTEFGRFAGVALDGGIVAIGGIRVITHDKGTAFILAYGKALWTHDLTIVYHQLLLGYGHPLSTLRAL